ncbi:hypothetical protein [Pontibacter diazotrophicus]|nr:hypothetical protein [Pontibacter diazotrophicus]
MNRVSSCGSCLGEVKVDEVVQVMEKYSLAQMQEYKKTLQGKLEKQHVYCAWDIVQYTPFPEMK